MKMIIWFPCVILATKFIAFQTIRRCIVTGHLVGDNLLDKTSAAACSFSASDSNKFGLDSIRERLEPSQLCY